MIGGKRKKKKVLQLKAYVPLMFYKKEVFLSCDSDSVSHLLWECLETFCMVMGKILDIG